MLISVPWAHLWGCEVTLIYAAYHIKTIGTIGDTMKWHGDTMMRTYALVIGCSRRSRCSRCSRCLECSECFRTSQNVPDHIKPSQSIQIIVSQNVPERSECLECSRCLEHSIVQALIVQGLIAPKPLKTCSYWRLLLLDTYFFRCLWRGVIWRFWGVIWSLKNALKTALATYGPTFLGSLERCF